MTMIFYGALCVSCLAMAMMQDNEIQRIIWMINASITLQIFICMKLENK